MSTMVPLYRFFILRARLSAYNAAAIAATYGSVSVVTFIAAGSLLDKVGIAYGGHMAATLVLMESPAIEMLVASWATQGMNHRRSLSKARHRPSMLITIPSRLTQAQHPR